MNMTITVDAINVFFIVFLPPGGKLNYLNEDQATRLR